LWRCAAAKLKISALPGDDGSVLSNLERAIVAFFEVSKRTLEALSARKYSSSAIFEEAFVV
jgi:hypothetical protein